MFAFARARPRRAIALALVSIVLLASALETRAVVPSVDGLPRLNDETFELETQSSTGQTTGTWVVLFERGESARSARARRKPSCQRRLGPKRTPEDAPVGIIT